MLDGTIESVDHFAIQAGSDFELSHNKTSKKLRFICLKGAVENNQIRWWKDREEFCLHCKSLKPIGFHGAEAPAEGRKPYQSPAARIDLEIRGLQTTPATRKRKIVDCPEPNEHTVYVLKPVDDSSDSYVGYTNHLNRRLAQHNRERAGGAQSTSGIEWTFHLVSLV